MARVFLRQTRTLKLLADLKRVREIALRVQGRESSKNVLRQVERLSDFAHSAFAAKCDDVCRHGRAVLAVSAVDFLDDGFASFAAGQVKVDIGPRSASFGQKPLEQQVASNRIAGGDSK